jgi:hypothetical protein
MFTFVRQPLAMEAWCDDDYLWVDLTDARRLGVPLVYFPRLNHATPEQRARLELIGDGMGVHWPDLDEDISVEGLLLGQWDNTSFAWEHRKTCAACGQAIPRAVTGS